ncbi:DNA-directed RNA polymerase III subunit RPC4 [Coemansia sp. RSA 2523]|nr:DNA-directed RNA polymerase III subunit RPC4 [Coemansia sp. RSA 1824]KAJ1787431.1 DNA-directed RNA polymerase III subunit RPC4 [Coemansia sp. RSA 2167]KAJ1805895.1 DNA-directed RNA polymerase III subunit RPC4 [Coemansia sp. RSA 2523]KAJ2154565.1 DNA-directed RNA polymerase III subunit RPC4 [Coemansia sp. RSA 637]KAJ2423350.1 DNA-directed RNA polymerase III subunit RPC4 [Coemansia sp. RSA 2524]KAJ2729726.1 DNA-directed RNA polymerase III subunit RPC4 [Coemansia sp. D1744]
MPDTPERKPSLRGRPLLRGRGRGASTSAGPSTGRLASIRRDGAASPTSSVGAPSPPATKLKFTPNIPARRIKREPSTPKIETKPTLVKPKVEMKEQRPRKRFELIERVTGPFAQGPASLSMSGRNTGAVGFSSITGAGVDIDTSRPELDGDLSRLDALIEETDHNKRARNSEFEVQTEEMALKAFERMSQLQLDYTAAQQFGLGNPQGEDSLEWAEDRLMVFQIPKLPLFEMDPSARQQLQQLRSSRRVERSIKVDMDVDVKPDIATLEINADVKTDVQTVDSDNETGDGCVDGRIGTLVVLKSGAVKMKIGDILFDVTQGAECSFLRGLLAVDVRGTNSTAHLLGNVETQLLCTPDLDSIA